jgi:hypothetical protein
VRSVAKISHNAKNLKTNRIDKKFRIGSPCRKLRPSTTSLYVAPHWQQATCTCLRPSRSPCSRRVGKTYFLDGDLTPAARDAGMLPVSADIWLHSEAPLEAINHALEEALDDKRRRNRLSDFCIPMRTGRCGCLIQDA